jgi:hypothetical protein
MTRRTVVLVSVCLIVLLLAGGAWRLKRHFVPAGAGFIPFLFHSTKPQAMVSPGGRTLHVRFNDGGAMHSGFHWTYLYTDHWFWGKRLALGGYSLPKVRQGEVPLPLTWTGDDSFTVEFATGRQQAKPVRKSGVLP